MSNTKHLKAVPSPVLPTLDPAIARALEAAACAHHRAQQQRKPEHERTPWHALAEAEREEHRLDAGAAVLAWREHGGPL